MESFYRRCEGFQAQHKSGHEKDTHKEEFRKSDGHLLANRISHTNIGPAAAAAAAIVTRITALDITSRTTMAATIAIAAAIINGC